MRVSSLSAVTLCGLRSSDVSVYAGAAPPQRSDAFFKKKAGSTSVTWLGSMFDWRMGPVIANDMSSCPCSALLFFAAGSSTRKRRQRIVRA